MAPARVSTLPARAVSLKFASRASKRTFGHSSVPSCEAAVPATVQPPTAFAVDGLSRNLASRIIAFGLGSTHPTVATPPLMVGPDALACATGKANRLGD